MDDLTLFAKTLVKILARRGERISYGQFGEDAVIQSLLKEGHGVYVDVGAYHPILYSNTYALYKKSWQGFAIDPNPRMRTPFKVFRPRDTFIQAAIGDRGTREYHSFNDEAYNTLNDAEAERRKTLPHLKYMGGVKIPVRPLGQILTEHAISAIDFLNIDVEGMDLQVLQSHNWSIRPRLIAVEVEDYNPDQPLSNNTYTFLHEKGYRLVAFSRLTLIWSDQTNK